MNKCSKINVTELEEIGTDPARVKVDLDETMVIPPIMKKRYQETFGSQITAAGEVPVFLYRSLVIKELMESMLENLSPPKKLLAVNCRLPGRQQDKVGYKARSLEGIVFTAPYLHNSSVPTLDDLFKPAHLRPKTFYIGCREYDMNKVGYNCHSNSPQAFLVDTDLPGASNQGHEYVTDMNAKERRAMIEYLKSIKNPATPPLGV